MRKSTVLLPQIKEQILNMKGKSIKLTVNRGRRKYIRYTGVLESVYPSLFTVRINNPTSIDLLSYSYSDILCGVVKISEKSG